MSTAVSQILTYEISASPSFSVSLDRHTDIKYFRYNTLYIKYMHSVDMFE